MMHGVASPNVRSDGPPIVRPRGRGSLPRLPVLGMCFSPRVVLLRDSPSKNESIAIRRKFSACCPMSVLRPLLSQEPRLKPDWHKALRLLDRSPRGATEDVLELAHGFSRETMAMLTRAGFATVVDPQSGNGRRYQKLMLPSSFKPPAFETPRFFVTPPAARAPVTPP